MLYCQYFLIIFVILYIHLIPILCYDVNFTKFLVQFLKYHENGIHASIYLESHERIFINNLTRTLSSNGIKSKISLNDDDFLINSNDAYLEMKIFNVTSPRSLEILGKAEKLGYFRAPYRWILLGGLSIVQQYNLYFRVDSRIFVCEEIPTGYNISTVHKVGDDFVQYQYNPIAFWSYDNGFVYYKPLSIYGTRRNLMGLQFKMSYLFNNPITYKTVFQYRMTHIDSSARFTFLITHLLVSLFNITPKYIIQSSYGSPIPNSTEYTGIIGDVKSGRSIMGATPLLMVARRISLLEYIAPNTECHVNFFFKSPRLSYVSNIFVKPFNEYVWYSCFVLIGLTFATMYTIIRWEWKELGFKMHKEYVSDNVKPAASDVAILQLAVISQQGTNSELNSSSGRIAMIFSLVPFMFLYTAYSANIVALLQSSSNSIKDAQDLVNSGIGLGVEKTPYFMASFKNPSDPLGKKMFEKKFKAKGDKFMMSLSEGTERMRNEFFAFFTEASSINKLISDQFDEAEKCSVRHVQYLRVREPWFITQKNGSYKELLKIGLLRVREVGFYIAERRRIFYENPTCTTKISKFFTAGLSDTYPGFLFYGIGCIIAFSVLLIEILVDKLKRSKREIQKKFFTSKKTDF